MHQALDPILAATTTGEAFPVRRIFCVARNYAAHAREMGSDPNREPPFFFTKWAETVIPDGAVMPYPPATRNLHHEAELVVAIDIGGADISAADAVNHIYGYACGLDMTRRDLQNAAKDHGRPWDAGKNFACAAPLGVIHPLALTGVLRSGEISLTVNGVEKQRGDLADMIWPVADVIAALSTLYRLEPGDLIYTGTPAGVGPVESGDQLRVRIAGLTPLTVTIG